MRKKYTYSGPNPITVMPDDQPRIQVEPGATIELSEATGKILCDRSPKEWALSGLKKQPQKREG